jgi:hypothetical protein
MEIRDLDHAEQLALLGLVQFIGESNRDVTDEESVSIARVVASIGAARYRELATEADERFTDEEALRDYVRSIARPEARELIYGTVLEVAMADTIQKNESDLLDWLASAWQIQVRFQPGGTH